MMTIKLLNSNKLLNIRKNIVFCLRKTTGCKSWKILQSRNFESIASQVTFSKTQFDFWGEMIQQEKEHFSFYRRFIFNIFFVKIHRKKNT